MRIHCVPMVPQRDWDLIQHHLGVQLTPDTRGIVAVDPDTEMMQAACVFQNWSYTSAMLHMWINNSFVLRHGFLEAIYDYFFNQAGKDVMIAMVPSHNEAALKLNAHIGLKETYRVKGGFRRDEDWVVMEGRMEDLERWAPAEEEVEA